MMGFPSRAPRGPFDFAEDVPPTVTPYGFDPAGAQSMSAFGGQMPQTSAAPRGMFGNALSAATGAGKSDLATGGINPAPQNQRDTDGHRKPGIPASQYQPGTDSSMLSVPGYMGQKDLASGFAVTTAPTFRKPTFFQHGGTGEKILATLGEVGLALSASNGDPYATMVLQNRMQQQAAQRRAQMQQMDPREVNGNLVQFDPHTGQYKTLYSAPIKPANNDTANDYAFIAQHLGQDKADEYLANLGDPIVTVPLSNGSVYSGPRSGLATAIIGGTTQAGDGQRKPVGKLTPIGPGGASPTGSRTFPIR